MKKTIVVVGLAFGFLGAFVSALRAATSIKIDGDTPWVVVDADYQTIPVQKAIRDAERDWYKVLGYPPVIFHNAPPSRWKGPVVLLGSAEHTKSLIDSEVPGGKEQYAVFTGELKQSNPAVVMAGSDVRGTIYAIYSFCEQVLGVDPMYIFTDNIPKKRKEIILEAGFRIVSKQPTFEYRGWFVDNEEIHEGLHKDPLGKNVISMEWSDKILETLLRCKANMIIPGSSTYPDATIYDLCQRRGVAITHHHVTPLGLNVMNWPDGVPFSYITHKEILMEGWKKSVKAQEGKEVAWIIGFRGKSDSAFWEKDPAAPPDDATRAATISEAMQAQVDIIRASDPDATIVAALWNEIGAFYNSGLLKVPAGVCKMFSDDGRGYMRDDGGKHIEAGDGLYYHVMMNMNTQNRTTELFPPARFYRELKRYVDKGATKYAIINVSNIQPAAMAVEAISAFMWDARPALSETPEAAMMRYLEMWYAKQFGPDLGPRLAALRVHYYNIPYMREREGMYKTLWKGARGEQLVHYVAKQMLEKYSDAVAQGADLRAIDGFDLDFRQSQEPVAEAATFFPSLWEKTLKLGKEVPEARKNYYQAQFIYQVAVHMYSCRAVTIMNQAFAGFLEDRNPQAFAKTVAPAILELEKVIEEAHKAEYGNWDTLFMHVRLLDFWRTRLLFKAVVAKCENKPYTDTSRDYYRGSWGRSAHDFWKQADGVFPFFHKSSGWGLEYLEQREQAEPPK